AGLRATCAVYALWGRILLRLRLRCLIFAPTLPKFSACACVVQKTHLAVQKIHLPTVVDLGHGSNQRPHLPAPSHNGSASAALDGGRRNRELPVAYAPRFPFT